MAGLARIPRLSFLLAQPCSQDPKQTVRFSVAAEVHKLLGQPKLAPLLAQQALLRPVMWV